MAEASTPKKRVASKEKIKERIFEKIVGKSVKLVSGRQRRWGFLVHATHFYMRNESSGSRH